MGVNACVECCDRWVKGGAVALEWYGASGGRQTVTFAQLKDDSARFANYLTSLGIGQGDVVAGLLPRIPDLMTVILGAWRVGGLARFTNLCLRRSVRPPSRVGLPRRAAARPS